MSVAEVIKKPSEKNTGLVYDDIYLKHDTGPGHPERAARLTAILDRLDQEGLVEQLERITPVETEMPWVQAVHTQSYIQTAERDISSGLRQLSTGDTAVCKDSYRVALCAVGGVIAAVDAIFSGVVRNAFCAVRPPGHHAETNAGMGFCIFNNAAIATRYAQRTCGIGKVLIVDWDIHHGNGTQEVFYQDGSIFYCSTHMNGIYPMPLTGKGYAEETGSGPGTGANLNIPLPAGSGDRELLSVFNDKIVPAARKFKPELVIISAGFDSRQDDPIGAFEVSDDGFAKLTEIVMDLVDQQRVLSVLEGGYNVTGLASAVAAHVKTMIHHTRSAK